MPHRDDACKCDSLTVTPAEYDMRARSPNCGNLADQGIERRLRRERIRMKPHGEGDDELVGGSGDELQP